MGADLPTRSLHALATVPVGFVADCVLVAEFRLQSSKFRTPEAITGFMSRAPTAVRTVSGVHAAALVACWLPARRAARVQPVDALASE